MLWHHFVTIYKPRLVKVLPFTSLFPFTKKRCFQCFQHFQFFFSKLFNTLQKLSQETYKTLVSVDLTLEKLAFNFFVPQTTKLPAQPN